MKPKAWAGPGLILLRVSEVAAILGFSRQHVYGLAASGELPSIKFRGAVRFDPQDVERFIRKHKRGGLTPRDAA